MNAALANYHRYLFRWHSRKFYPFRLRLTAQEKNYLEVCFRLPQDYREVSETGYRDFSYYTYSHRVVGDEVNSSRIAYGSVAHPGPAWEAAQPVLAERQIPVAPFFSEAPTSRFYGLGWDLLEKQFKIYFRVVEMSNLPADLSALTAGHDLSLYRAEGLVSFTYTENQLSERKVYLYPDNKQLPEGAKAEAMMLTDRRGAVAQYDLAAPDDWALKLNPAGQKIVELYSHIDEQLDTIAYQDPDHFTLYFP